MQSDAKVCVINGLCIGVPVVLALPVGGNSYVTPSLAKVLCMCEAIHMPQQILVAVGFALKAGIPLVLGVLLMHLVPQPSTHAQRD